MNKISDMNKYFSKIRINPNWVTVSFMGLGCLFFSCDETKEEFVIPEIDLLFPENGAWVEGSFDVEVLVSSTVGLNEIELIVNDQLTAVGSVGDISRIVWNTQDLSEGNYSPRTVSLFTKIKMPDGEVVTSDTIIVTVLFPRQLTFNIAKDVQPEWNFEGTSIIFKSNRELPDSVYSIYSVDLSGEPPIIISTERFYHGYPGWSPNGEYVVFNSYDLETEHWWEDMNIFIANVSTGETNQVTIDTLFDDSGRWSPDGNWISFHSNRNGGTDLWKIPIDEFGMRQGNPVQLTFDHGDEECARWSPNGEWLIFEYSNHSGLDYGDGFGNIGIVNSEGGDINFITNDSYQNGYPNWSPNGQYIIYNSKQYWEKDLFIKDYNNNEIFRITMDPGKDEHATWSPNGNSIAFASDRSGNKDIWIVEIPDILNGE
jgi:TolB protein